MTAPMDVVFSFDTTGSMSQVLDEVKCRLNDLIQRLQADIPQFKVGIIAHGDYCDKDEFYDIRTHDLTDNLPDVVNFVSETTGTGGGDIPECYELSLRRAREMSWRPGSRRVFVVIGDAYPHGPNYPQNTMKIDWQDELSSLVEKNVTVYGVQYGQDPEAVSFFQRLASQSGGQHLRLQDMGDICHVIMAICYREQDSDLLQTYEAEVRADNDATALNVGLENAFSKLGKSDSIPAAAPLVKKASLALSLISSVSSVGSADTTILSARKDNVNHTDLREADCAPASTNTNNGWDSDDSDLIGSFRIILPPGKMKRKKQNQKNETEKGCSSAKKAKIGNSVSSGHKTKKHIPTKGNVAMKRNGKKINPMRIGKRSKIFQRSRRDAAGDKQFRFNDLPWSKWHLAAARQVPEGSGIWKTVAQRGSDDTLWRTDLLRLCEKKLTNDLVSNHGRELRSRIINNKKTSRGGILFEVGVISPDSRDIQAMWLHATNQRKSRTIVPRMLSIPWYHGLTRPISRPLTAAAKAGSRVYIRWAVVKDVQTVKRDILTQYEYLWRS